MAILKNFFLLNFILCFFINSSLAINEVTIKGIDFPIYKSKLDDFSSIYRLEKFKDKYKVKVENGIIIKHGGEIFNSYLGPLASIFVLDIDGNFLISPYQEHMKFHHSSFVNNGPVLMAGEILIYRGEVIGISNRSGHYFPSEESLQSFLKLLKKMGLRKKPILNSREELESFMPKFEKRGFKLLEELCNMHF